MDIAKNLGLTGMKKYWRRAGQMKKKVNSLYENWILVLATFIKQFRKTHNNEEVSKNIKIRQKIDPE